MCTKNRSYSLFQRSFLSGLFLVTFILFVSTVSASKESKAVDTWAQKFGNELNDLARKMTKVNEIKKKYKEYNARVIDKGELINSTVKNVGKMLQRKIDAVRCIVQKAENESANFIFDELEAYNNTYYSSKYSRVNTIKCCTQECLTLSDDEKTMYKDMTLTRDTHFYNISVNTEYSSVHVPVNVYDNTTETLKVLMWSEALDTVFKQNYKSDPALSWQYFGSETGVLRHYPAKLWQSRDNEIEIDVSDCRKTSWYIETATCSKDVIILLDNTGSMHGFHNFLAQLTIKSILDTFSNNDFFNIMTFNETVQPLVKCFANETIQATPENIEVFNEHLKLLNPDGYIYAEKKAVSGIDVALIDAFTLLERYRNKRGCNGDDLFCNQAIMLVADGLQGNFTDIFETYNRVQTSNGTKIPVRMFPYLLGKELVGATEMQKMACENRGDFQHIQTLDEVKEKVLEYVSVIARPLVLQEVAHPPTWTHAFKDVTYRDEESSIAPGSSKKRDYVPPRLMISVGVPAFGKIITKKNETESGLLGVASTDVPVDDINKLSLPYKLGVNGYSFVISNNGYVLFHPDLRPMFPIKGDYYKLKINYNSIDLTEIEQIYDDGIDNHINKSLRPVISKALSELRDLALSHEFGSILNVSVRFHYDKMRRVSDEKYDYYFAPLELTPFTLGLAIPSTYGQTFIKVGNEIKENKDKQLNISEWFVGENWKVHPDWVYCKYHYLEGHEFDSAEMELKHFLKSFYNDTWKWSEQYETDASRVEESLNCDRKTLDDHGYYCNQELVQLLVFDAKVTNASYGEWKFESEQEKELIDMYNATLRFVATMSGLTRWQFIFGETEVADDKEFGDYYKRAIDETWYKSAVLQHKIDPDSFVYSVPHDDKDETKEEGELKVTASHAIFRTDGLKKAPGCVVGFQFKYELMGQRFQNITTTDNCNGCLQGCSDLSIDCYVIDNNGYVVISKEIQDIGRFFGEVEGYVMEDLVEIKVFKRDRIYDFQALCKDETDSLKTNDGNGLITPFRFLLATMEWALAEIFICLSQLNFQVAAEEEEDAECAEQERQGRPDQDRQQDDELDDEKDDDEDNEDDDEEKDEIEQQQVNIQKEMDKYYTCDKAADLYIMQQESYAEIHSTSSLSGSYYFSRIPFSNLLLIYIKRDDVLKGPRLDAAPVQIQYSTEFPCYKLNVNNLSVRILPDCFTEHPDENRNITCSDAVAFSYDQVIMFVSLLLSIICTFISRV